MIQRMELAAFSLLFRAFCLVVYQEAHSYVPSLESILPAVLGHMRPVEVGCNFQR